MLERLTDTLNFQAAALSLRAERQRIIASNIANADTPGYQARDMNFAQALKNATGAMGGAGGAQPSTGGVIPIPTSGMASMSPMPTLALTQPGHMTTAALAGGAPGSDTPLLYATPSQTNLDRNTVDMDRERATFADNTVHYEATLRFLSSSVKTLTSAITGQS